MSDKPDRIKWKKLYSIECDNHESTRQRLAAKDADTKDAERYRFLKTCAYVGISRNNECLWVLRGIYEIDGKGFDAAIDKELLK